MSMTEIRTPEITPGGGVIQLVEPERFERVEHPVPEPRAGEVVVAIRELGLCGTDIHIFRGRGDSYPHVVGHDGVGVVHTIGPGVKHLSMGERVTVDPVVSCDNCHACRRGEVQLCPAGGYLGMIGPGLLAQYVRLPARQVVGIPDEVTDHAATVLEPVTVTLHMLSRIESFLAESVPCAIIGSGPLAIVMARVLEHHGYEPHLFEPLEQRRRLASSLGLFAHPPDPIDLGPDRRLVVETSATSGGVALADAMATSGSVVAVVGRAPESIAPASVLLKELTIVGVKGGPRRYEEAVRLVAEGVVDPAAVITHEYQWDEADRAFGFTAEHPEKAVRTVLAGAW